MTTELEGRDKWRWIFEAGWRGLCPHCGEGRMFRRWLKVSDRCEACGLDYDFAAPDDGPAFFSLCFIAFPLLFLVVWFEVAMNPPWWAHLLVSAPLMIVPCLAALHPIKGWLVASQYVNQAQEAGTGALWAGLNARAKRDAEGRTPYATAAEAAPVAPAAPVAVPSALSAPASDALAERADG